jgi:subtilisin family serine protease
MTGCRLFRLLTVIPAAGALALGVALLPPRAARAQLPLPSNLSYLVVFKEGVPNPADLAAQLSRQHGLALGMVFGKALRGFAAAVPQARLAALARDPRVAYIEPDQFYRATAAFSIPTGVDRVDADASATAKIDATNDGVNVDIAILDTGIQTNHPDLNVVGGRNFTSFIGSNNSYTDGNGHGTHVAGIAGARDNGVNSGGTHVVGTAPGARLWAVKVLNTAGGGYTSWIVAGIDWVTDTKKHPPIEVANMSLSGGNSKALNDAIARSVASGVTYVVAAGNSNTDCQNASPANSTSPGVITVSAIADYNGRGGGGAAATTSYGADDTFASFSNYGTGDNGVDLCAPGVDILSTYRNSGYRRQSGTSMAAPLVAGAAALRIATSGGSPADVKSAVLAAARPASDAGFGYSGGSKDGTDEPVLYAGGF